MNDVVIEFATSFYTQDDYNNSRIPTGKNVGDFKQYHVVTGSVFNMCYNETLDSATVLLSHIRLYDRLINLKAYQYVCVRNLATNKKHTYLIDNFNEVEDNITEHIFSYTINLMSETKILEKIQCPNRTVTHKVINGSISKKTIYQLIVENMKLYCPKIKYTDDNTTWYYKPMIEVPEENSNFYNRFNVTSADLPSTAPTLRQLLTILMQQVGCIPTVKDGVLGFLDFQLEAQPFADGDFTANHTVNKITRSLSSDSFANTLVDMSSNVLDSGNVTYSERLGFRDSNNVLLKQTSNLYLETKFPIYKVNKFYINIPLNNTYIEELNDRNNAFWATLNIVSENGDKYATLLFEPQQDLSSATVTVSGTVYALKFNRSLNKYEQVAYYAMQEELTGNDDVEVEIHFTTNSFDYCYFVGSIDSTSATFYSVPETLFLTTIRSMPLSDSYAKLRFDITDLLVESSVRQNLETNYLNMRTGANAVTTISDLSKYIYGTLGYTINSKRISGFSEMFTETLSSIFGPIQVEQTYIENIIYFLGRITNASSLIVDTISNFYNMPYISYSWLTTTYENIYANGNKLNIYTPTGVSSFIPLTFDIEYQPLNSFNLSFVKKKEDIDFPIEQLNTSANGLSDFDRLSIHQQEQVDRIGNETLVIHQRTKNFNDIQNFDDGPLYFQDDLNRDEDYSDENEDIKHIIFKIQYIIKNFYYEVSYTASKDSILKNYFTSIRTKYRAYQYVDYSNSVLRKEKDVIHVRISDTYYNGDDKIYFGYVDTSALSLFGDKQQLSRFIDGIRANKDYITTIKYECEKSLEKDEPTNAKNDISIICNYNSFAIIYENTDNAGAGPYISNSAYSTSYDFDEGTYKIGGVPQTWQIWDEEYNDSHSVYYTYDLFKGYNGEVSEDIDNDLQINAQLPKISSSMMDINNSRFDAYIAFSVVEDNSDVNKMERLFYKDYAERINHTVQFIYYTDTDSIRWTEYFIKNNSFVGGIKFEEMGYIEVNSYGESFESNSWFNEEEGVSTNPSEIHPLSSVVFVDDTSEVPSIKVNWENITSDFIKVIGITQRTSGWALYYNVIAFKNPGDGSTKIYYVTLNDTKSDYVMKRDSSTNILYRYAKVQTNSLVREVQNTFKYVTGDLTSTGIASITCYDYNTDTEVVNNSTIDRGQQLYFTAEADYGYFVTVYASQTHPVSVNSNVVGKNYVVATALTRYVLTTALTVEGVASVLVERYRNGAWETYTGTEIFQGQQLRFTYTADSHYTIDGTNPVEVTVTSDINVNNYVSATGINYGLVGLVTNGNVYFYADDNYQIRIENAAYGARVYYEVEPNTGYSYSGTDGSVIVNTDNFSIVDNTATIDLGDCDINDYDVTFELTSGIQRIYFKVGEGAWRYRDTTDTISIEYNSEVEWYAVPKVGCKIASGTPTANAHAFFNVPAYNITKTANYNLITYDLTGNTIEHGDVYFYLNYQHTGNPVTEASYGTDLWCVIEPENQGYSAPTLPNNGKMTLNGDNFTLDDANETAIHDFGSCTINSYNLTINIGTGVSEVWYRFNSEEGGWRRKTATDTLTVEYNTYVEWYAVPSSGYDLDSGVPTSNNIAHFDMPFNNYSISATASRKQLTLLPANNSISHATFGWYDNQAWVQTITQKSYGTTVYYKLTANTGYHLGNDQTKTEESAGKVINTTNFTIDNTNNTATANFLPTVNINSYSVTITKGSNIISIVYSTNGGSSWTTSASTVSLTLNYGVNFAWYANISPNCDPSSGTPTSASNPDEFVVSSNVSKTASATKIAYTLSGVSTHGTVTWYKNGVQISSAEYGDTVSYVITPNTGYEHSSPTGSLTVNTTDFTISGRTASHTFSACTKIQYTFTFYVGSNIQNFKYMLSGTSNWVTKTQNTQITVEYGTEVYWYATPITDYDLVGDAAGHDSEERAATIVFNGSQPSSVTISARYLSMNEMASVSAYTSWDNKTLYVDVSNTSTHRTIEIARIIAYTPISQTVSGYYSLSAGTSHTFTKTISSTVPSGSSVIITFYDDTTLETTVI